MKKVFIIVFGFLFLTTFVYAKEPIQLAKMPQILTSPSPTAGGSCSADSGDLYNQGFEAGTLPSGWATVAGTPDYGATPPTLVGCASCCTKSLRINPSAAAMWSYYDEGTARAEVYIRFYLYIASSGDMSGNEYIFATSPNTNYGANQLSCYDSGTVSCRFQGAVDSAWVACVTGQQNRVEMHIIQNGAVTLRINGVDNATDGTAADLANRYYNFGSDAAKTWDFYVDEFAVSTTGWIGAP